ncbi:MAG: hypothetical protein GY776_08835 [Alteromonas sp.]|nr:hypothetical protein [Alteromonas sp.]
MIIVKDNRIVSGKLEAGRQELNQGYFMAEGYTRYGLDAKGNVIPYTPEVIVDSEGNVEFLKPGLRRKLASGDWVWANVKGKYAQYKYDTTKEWHLAECIHCGDSPVIIGCICVDCEAQMYAIDRGEEIWHDEEPEIGCKICYSVDKDLDAEGWCEDCQNIDLESAEEARLQRIQREQEY